MHNTYLTALVVESPVKVPEPFAPEVARGLCQEGSQLALVQPGGLWVPALSKQLPHVLELQVPEDANV